MRRYSISKPRFRRFSCLVLIPPSTRPLSFASYSVLAFVPLTPFFRHFLKLEHLHSFFHCPSDMRKSNSQPHYPSFTLVVRTRPLHLKTPHTFHLPSENSIRTSRNDTHSDPDWSMVRFEHGPNANKKLTGCAQKEDSRFSRR